VSLFLLLYISIFALIECVVHFDRVRRALDAVIRQVLDVDGLKHVLLRFALAALARLLTRLDALARNARAMQIAV
jgi:hypothetical protein